MTPRKSLVASQSISIDAVSSSPATSSKAPTHPQGELRWCPSEFTQPFSCMAATSALQNDCEPAFSSALRVIVVRGEGSRWSASNGSVRSDCSKVRMEPSSGRGVRRITHS